MRILITGGTGLIGRHLCKALLAEGHELTVFSRNPGSVPAKCGAGVYAMAALTEWQPDKVFDAVINLAGEPIVDARWTEQRKQVLWASRVTLTEELVSRIAAAERKPAVLLSGSAVGYYGGRGDAMLDETSEAGADFPAQLCVAWESAATVAENLGVRVCLLRDGQMRGPYNMTAPSPVTNAEFTAVLAAVLRRPAPFVAPAALLRLSMGESASLLLEGQRVLPIRLTAAGIQFKFPELRDALDDLLSR